MIINGKKYSKIFCDIPKNPYLCVLNKKIMKKLLVFSMVLVSFVSYGQNFTFKRVFFQSPQTNKIMEKQDGLALLITGNPNILKMVGEVTITDTTIDMIQNGVKSKMIVTTTSKGMGTQQFRMKINEDIDMRLTLAPNPSPSRNEDYIFIMETKDKFTNTNQSFMYYLTSVKNN